MNANSPIKSSNKKLNAVKKFYLPVRYYIAALGSVSSAVMFAVRCNLSVAIVAMVSRENHITRENGTTNATEYAINIESDQKVTFRWNGEEEGIVLGSYYYGYALVQIATGLLADKFDCVQLAIITNLFASFLTLITPFAASQGIVTLSLVRAALGLAHAPMLSLLYALFRRWFPLNEMSLPLSLMQAGSNFGIAIIMPITAWFCTSNWFGGWPMAFYFAGFINLILPLIWFTTVTTRPEDHFWITEHELKVLSHGVDSNPVKDKIKVHWKRIFTSTALWSLVLTRTGQSFGYMALNTKIPAYFETVLGVNLRSNGLFNSTLYIAMACAQAASGPLAKFVIDKGYLPRTATRKLFETFALSISSLCLAIVPSIGAQPIIIMSLLMVSTFFMGLVAGGHMPIVSEMAPNLSGTIFGITNFFASSMGFLAPMVVGILLDSGSNVEAQWNIVFYAGAVFMIIVNIIFIIFGTSKPQPWSSKDESHDNATMKSQFHKKDLNAMKTDKKLPENEFNLAQNNNNYLEKFTKISSLEF